MLDETFAESLAHVPAPFHARLVGRLCQAPASGHVIIGKRLRPYTFWAAANLDFVKSPFLGHPTETGKVCFPDIYVASRCCRLRWPHTITIPRVDFELSVWRYGRRFAKDIKYRADQIRRIVSYLKDYDSQPEHITSDSAKPVSLPWYLYHVAMLVKHAGLTIKQAWGTEIGFGQWWVTAMLIASGHSLELVTPEDRRQLAEIEKENRNTKPESRNTEESSESRFSN